MNPKTSNPSKNIVSNLENRQQNDESGRGFQRQFYVTEDLIFRLSLCAELQGHSGCVNCLQWNDKGTILASGSDDCHVILWDPFGRRKLRTIETGHTNNIFSVQFAPESGDRIVISGAGDSKVRVHDVNNTTYESVQVYSCHFARVKRLAVAPTQPNLFWSAGEDGIVMQFDLREPATCKNICKHVLINLNAHLGPDAEIKCLSVNPCRPELLAVGANDPYVRVYDRRMLSLKNIKMQPSGDRNGYDRSAVLSLAVEKENYNFPPSAVQYYIAGHLPIKYQDFRRRYRPLASTYVTFSPCGSNLLVNLGGEQIYLFDINTRKHSVLSAFRKFFDSPWADGCIHGGMNGASTSNGYNFHTSTTNGFSSTSNGFSSTSNGFTKLLHSLANVSENSSTDKHRQPLSARADRLKQQANSYFEKKNYNLAVAMYSEAIALSPRTPVLFANRAASYIKRDWDGDVYAALRDCYSTLQLEPDHLKAHFRLAKCLFDLKQYKSAQKCLEMFKVKYPEQSNSPNCLALDKDIIGAILENHNARAAKRKRNRSGSLSESDVIYETFADDMAAGSASNSSNGVWKSLNLSDQEIEFRESACDYELRFCGHCNTTTDIKEANFFGCNGEYIVGGSDDGKFFIWDRKTCNIVRALMGDESIVNCLQPHPTQCLLASSGIDSTVKLWCPRPEDGSQDSRDVPDQGNAAMANQRRMNADPLEVMLLNMGYRISGLMDVGGGGGENAEGAAPPVQCHQS